MHTCQWEQYIMAGPPGMMAPELRGPHSTAGGVAIPTSGSQGGSLQEIIIRNIPFYRGSTTDSTYLADARSRLPSPSASSHTTARGLKVSKETVLVVQFRAAPPLFTCTAILLSLFEAEPASSRSSHAPHTMPEAGELHISRTQRQASVVGKKEVV
jgi:hypothetical protein